jgi:phosphocarrier protein HPr
MSKDDTLSRESGSVWLAHPAGLHARPAIQLTKLAKRFQADIWIGVSADGPWTNAKSIARVLAMKTPSQTELYFSAEGDDASEAVEALVRLVESNFTSVLNDGT